jgi:hypothetical protein
MDNKDANLKMKASIHCLYKTCKNKCNQQKRGRHCPKQKKITEII